MNAESRIRPRSFERKSVAFVIPFYNEAANLRSLVQALETYSHHASSKWSIAIDAVFVDDGSVDGGFDLLREIAQNRQWPMRLRMIRLSRNFGKEAALTAGLDVVETDAVVLIDADLQHPFAVVDDFIAGWLDGFDIVYGVAKASVHEGAAKKLARKLAYVTMNADSDIPIPSNAGDFRLMSRRAYSALRQLGERRRLMKGLYGWIGFRQKAVAYEPAERISGSTKFSALRLWAMTMDGVTSNTLLPLRLSAMTGFAGAILTSCYAVWTIFEKVYFGISVPGYPTLIVLMGFVGALQLIFLGVIGEYLGRVLVEVKQRPRYIVESDISIASKSPRLAALSQNPLKDRGDAA
ncbi:MAG: glycosyltransferase family 2 protein [Proteobacteria bacterium]|nr:glycosyltransferase family 2 protein [Pseudomonadota bacterium]